MKKLPISVLIVFFGIISSQACEQALFDATYYPLAEPAKTILENAQKELQHTPHDSSARQKLKQLAVSIDTPSVQAIRELASSALKEKNYNDALYWSNMGSGLGDPYSKLTQASLILNPHQVSTLKLVNPHLLSWHAEFLLRDAAKLYPIQTSDGSTFFNLTWANHYLRLLLHDKHEVQEKFFNAFGLDEQRALLHNPAQIQENFGFGFGCCFIKKFARPHHYEQSTVISLLESMLEAPTFDPFYFRVSGAYEALNCMLNEAETALIREKIHLLLGKIGYKEIIEGTSCLKEETITHLQKGMSDFDPACLLMIADLASDADTRISCCKKIIGRMQDVTVRDTYSVPVMNHVMHLIGQQKFEALSLAIQLGSLYKNNTEPDRLPDEIAQFFDTVRTSAKNAPDKYKKTKQKLREYSYYFFEQAFKHENVVAAGLALLARFEPNAKSKETAQALFLQWPDFYKSTRNTETSDDTFRSLYTPLLLQTLENLTAYSSNPFAQEILAQLYFYGLEGLLTPDKQKAFDYVKNLKEISLPFLYECIKESDNPELSWRLALKIYDKEKNLSVDHWYTTYVEPLLVHADLSCKEMMLKECLMQNSDALLIYAAKIMKAYIHEVQQKEHQKSNIQLMGTFLKALSNSPTGTIIAARLLKEIEKTERFFNDPQLMQQKKGIEDSVKKLMADGNPHAIELYIEDYIQYVANEQSAKEFAGYIYRLYKAAHARQMQTLQENALKKMEKLATCYPCAELFYYTMMMKADKDPEAAFHAYIKAEEWINTQDEATFLESRPLLEKIGGIEVLQTLAQQGHGWACWILAMQKYRQLDPAVHNKATLKELKEIKKNLQKAPLSVYSFEVTSDLDVGLIEYRIGREYELVADYKSQFMYFAKAIKHYDKGAKAGNPYALYEWARHCLEGKLLPKNQKMLQTALIRLARAAQGKHDQAIKLIIDILGNAYDYIPECGGMITTELLLELENAFVVCAQPELPANARICLMSKDGLIKSTNVTLKEAYVALLKNRDYQKAYALFLQEAECSNNAIAWSYLGIMERDKLVPNASVINAATYFKNALLASCTYENDDNSYKIVQHAYHYIAEQPPHTENTIALINFLLKNFRYENVLQLCFNTSMDAKKVALQNILKLALSLPPENDILDLLIQQGTIVQFNTLYCLEKNLSTLGVITTIFAHRLAGLSLQEQERYSPYLIFPFRQLKVILEDIILQRVTSEGLGCLEDALVEKLLRNLSALALSPTSLSSTATSIISLLHLIGCKEKTPWADPQKGVYYLVNGNFTDDKTLFLKGFLLLVGNQLNFGIAGDEKKGIEILKHLIEKGNVDALNHLAAWYQAIEKGGAATLKKVKEGKSYLNDLIAKEGSLASRARYFKATLCFENALRLSVSAEDVYKLFQEAMNQEFSKQVSLHQAYLAMKTPLVFKDSSLQERLTPDFIMQQLESTLKPLENSQELKALVYSLQIRHNLSQILDEWCKEHEKKWAPQVCARAYRICGWLHFIMSRTMKARFSNSFLKESVSTYPGLVKKAVSYLEKAALIDEKKLIECKCMQLCYSFFDADSINYGQIKKEVLAVCSLLNKHKLSIADIPFLSLLLSECKNYAQNYFPADVDFYSAIFRKYLPVDLLTGADNFTKDE